MMARQNLQQAPLLQPLAKSIQPVLDSTRCVAMCIYTCCVTVYLSMHASFYCLECVSM